MSSNATYDGVPSAEALERLFAQGNLVRLGDGSRRVCFRLPGTGLCVKSYRTEDERDMRLKPDGTLERHPAKPAVVREIRRARFTEDNTSCQEARYYEELKRRLPPAVFAVFPDVLVPVLTPSRGWCLVETELVNADATPPLRFADAWRRADRAGRQALEKAFHELMAAFVAHAVRFYDPQNVLVQRDAAGAFRLRIADFEPASRTLVPIDLWCPAFVRLKVRRRAERFLNALKAGMPHLPAAERARWDAIVAEEGGCLGLSACRAFLENKLINDVFYEGAFKGRPCVVKCSSRAPASIVNEARILARVAAVDPAVCPAVLATWTAPDGKRAFVVTEKLPGPALADLIARGATPAEADAALEDVAHVLETLRTADVVWRDVIPANFMRGADGRFRILDAQFACVRDGFREDPYLLTHWKYRLLGFAFLPALAGRGWNDAAMALEMTRDLAGGERAARARTHLAALAETGFFASHVTPLDYVRVFLYGLETTLRKPFARSRKKRRSLAERARRAWTFARGT